MWTTRGRIFLAEGTTRNKSPEIGMCLAYSKTGKEVCTVKDKGGRRRAVLGHKVKSKLGESGHVGPFKSL